MKTPSTRRGFTLVECMIAIGVVGVGALGTARMVTLLYKSTADTEAVSEAIALATRTMSELQDAPMTDVGLSIHDVELYVPSGSISTVGYFSHGDPTPSALATPTSSLLVAYEVKACGYCTSPFLTTGYGAGSGLDGLDLEVSVYNVGSSNRLLQPIHFVLRKSLSPTIAASPR